MDKQKNKLSEIAKKIYCSNVKEIEPVFNEYVRYKINAHGIAFDILTRLQQNSPVLYIFGQSTIRRENIEKYGLPLFHRWSWIANFPYSVIILSDPTLSKHKLAVGWFQGTQDQYYLPILCEIIDTFLEKINIAPHNVISCGSSAGGFSALMMASYFPKSSVFVNNPQTDIRKYRDYPVNKLFNCVFPNISPEEINEKQIARRLSVIERYSCLDHIPNIYYMQNTKDTFHMQHQYMPFIEKINQIILDNPNFKDVKLVIELYSDEEIQHGPLPKEEFLKRLKRILFLFNKDK